MYCFIVGLPSPTNELLTFHDEVGSFVVFFFFFFWRGDSFVALNEQRSLQYIYEGRKFDDDIVIDNDESILLGR